MLVNRSIDICQPFNKQKLNSYTVTRLDGYTNSYYLHIMLKTLSIFLLTICLSVQSFDTSAQSNAGPNVNIDAELSELMNDLKLTDDQGVIIGLLILKYSLEYDYNEYQTASKAKQYTMVKAMVKELDKDLKEVLDKKQYKIYKKKKKEIKKKLMKRNWFSISVQLFNRLIV